MAAPWPPPYQQASGPSQAYDSNMYQHATRQHQAWQPNHPPYVQRSYGYPQGQQQYQQQPQQYCQPPANPPGYVQRIHPHSGYHPYQQAQQTQVPAQYQSGHPMQQQPASAQAFSQPQSVLSGYHYQSQPSQMSPVQPYPAGNTQQQQSAAQGFSQQLPSYTATELVSQQPQPQQISTPQQQQSVPPPSSISSQSPGPPASPEKDHLQEKKPSVPCFNCGSFDHWAVSCPEPLREVPAGRLIRQNQQPPAKRQKFNAPIITKYQVPALNQAQITPPSHPFSSYGHSSYVQAPQQYQIPPTPVSAQSPPGHWPPIGHPPPPAPPQHYPYATTPQTPTQYFGPSPVTQMSPPGPSQNSPGFPPQVQHQVQHQQHFPPSQAYHTPFSNHTSASPTSSQISRQPFVQPPGAGAGHQGPSPSVPLVQSQGTTAKLEPLDIRAANDEDDLSMLDIPDCPAEEGESKATLVGRPLPTNFVVADALAPFDAPALGDGGRCRSKYLDRANANDKGQNIKESGEWEYFSKDPIFNEITSGGNVILLSVLDLIYRPNRIQEPSDSLEANLADDNYSPSNRDLKEESDEINSHDSSPRGRRCRSVSGGADKPLKRQTPSPRSPINLALTIKTEEVVATPSVNVAAKSMESISRPYPPPTPQDGTGDPGRFSTSRSASPRRHESYSYHNISPPDSGADGRTRSEDLAVDRRQSYHREDSSRYRNDRSSTQRPQPVPPPPPPPARRPSMYDGSSSSPLSPGSVQINASAFVPDKNSRDGSGASHSHYPGDDYAIPPVRLRTERSYSHKREYAMRDESSDEDETVRRRQADDVTPKQKKRQPKVAEAYSRRW